MNFFGHSVIAQALDSHPAFLFGTMLPDFVSMSGARFEGLDAQTPHRQEVPWGIEVHHATDAVFHSTPHFLRYCSNLTKALEEAGKHDEARSVASDLAQHDRGRWASYLRGTGAITLITDVPVEVKLHRYVEIGRRMEPVFERDLGPTPLKNLPVEMGEYLLTLHHPDRPVVRYPVWIRRQEHWDGVPPGETEPFVIRIPRADGLADDDCYVPAGWFWAGDDDSDYTLPLERQWCGPMVVKKYPVTVGEYCAFLNGLWAEGRHDEALDAEPRLSAEEPYLERDSEGTWLGIKPDIENLESWPRTPDMPITLISATQARA